MTSARKVSANQKNAQKSTGPKSPSGKTKSSINALTHGLSRDVMLCDDEDKQLRDIKDQLTSCSPANPDLRQCAHEVGLSIIELARVKRAKRAVWEEASFDHRIVLRGELYDNRNLLDMKVMQGPDSPIKM